MRKLSAFLAMMLIASLPSMAATKITVKQLDEILADQHKAGKSDQAVSVKLQDLELTEMLSTDAMNNLTQYDPGPYTVTQIRVLELESAMLPPPPSEFHRPPLRMPPHRPPSSPRLWTTTPSNTRFCQSFPRRSRRSATRMAWTTPSPTQVKVAALQAVLWK